MIRVLFVCLGNICRSPTAEGIFQSLVKDQNLQNHIEIDSAGTHAFHVGSPPDGRAQGEAKRRGNDISHLRGRQATARDFETFDYILAMDDENHRNLLHICPPGQEHKLRMLLSFAPDLNRLNVPDPYYEGGFDTVYDMIETAAEALLQDIQVKHL